MVESGEMPLEQVLNGSDVREGITNLIATLQYERPIHSSPPVSDTTHFHPSIDPAQSALHAWLDQPTTPLHGAGADNWEDKICHEIDQL